MTNSASNIISITRGSITTYTKAKLNGGFFY